MAKVVQCALALTIMAHFHYSAELALSVPFLVALPLGVVPASGYYFTVFLAP